MNLTRWNLDSTKDREIVMTKIFDEPPEFVFRMYTKPEFIDQWWGPDGFRTKTSSMDFRTGGSWRYQMISSDGQIFDNLVNYLRIKTNREIIYTLSSIDDNDHEFLTIITFDEHPRGTELMVQMVFKTTEQYKFTVEEIGAIEGLQQTLNHLEEYLKRQMRS